MTTTLEEYGAKSNLDVEDYLERLSWRPQGFKQLLAVLAEDTERQKMKRVRVNGCLIEVNIGAVINQLGGIDDVRWNRVFPLFRGE